MYAYQPLPDQSTVRVLVLSPGEEDDPLSGFLQTVRMIGRSKASATPQVMWKADKPYEAISYVWGSNTKDHVILLDGEVHQITANLSDALRQCRLPDQVRTLWADSICINQNDPTEKGQQVVLMGRIYSCSLRTLVCLGTDPRHGDYARDAFALLYDTNRMIESVFHSPDFSWALDSFPRPDPDDPLVNDPRWQSVLIMTDLPWFSRGWVVQEVALGCEAVIHWAGSEISWPILIRADYWYTQRVRELTNKSDRVDWFLPRLFGQTFGFQRVAERRTFVGTERTTARDLGLLPLLELARDFGLTDPRDRIYAFMAVPIANNPIPDMRPSYQLSHLEIYQDFAVRFLERSKDLNILSHVVHNEQAFEEARMSSWVPRWDFDRWQLSLVSSSNKFGDASADSSNFTISYDNGDNLPFLQVRAVIFDRIRFVSKRLDGKWAVEDVVALWRQILELISLAPGRVEPDALHNNRLAFLQTLIAGTWGASSLEEWSLLLGIAAKFLETDGVQDSATTDSQHIPTAVQYIHQLIQDLTPGSKFVLLERGSFGIAQWIVEEGDICAFVFGVTKPIILREIPGKEAHHYKVVGPAYVVSKQIGSKGIPLGLANLGVWVDWDELCESEGWAHLELKMEIIVLE